MTGGDGRPNLPTPFHLRPFLAGRHDFETADPRLVVRCLERVEPPRALGHPFHDYLPHGLRRDASARLGHNTERHRLRAHPERAPRRHGCRPANGAASDLAMSAHPDEEDSVRPFGGVQHGHLIAGSSEVPARQQSPDRPTHVGVQGQQGGRDLG